MYQMSTLSKNMNLALTKYTTSESEMTVRDLLSAFVLLSNIEKQTCICMFNILSRISLKTMKSESELLSVV